MSIDRLAAKVAAIPPNARGRRRYPEALKREIMAALAASQMTHKAFAERLGISGMNLCHWRELAPKRAAKKRQKASFKKIILEPESVDPGSLCMRMPNGAVLEGLSVATAAELITSLSRGAPC